MFTHGEYVFLPRRLAHALADRGIMTCCERRNGRWSYYGPAWSAALLDLTVDPPPAFADLTFEEIVTMFLGSSP